MEGIYNPLGFDHLLEWLTRPGEPFSSLFYCKGDGGSQTEETGWKLPCPQGAHPQISWDGCADIISDSFSHQLVSRGEWG